MLQFWDAFPHFTHNVLTRLYDHSRNISASLGDTETKSNSDDLEDLKQIAGSFGAFASLIDLLFLSKSTVDISKFSVIEVVSFIASLSARFFKDNVNLFKKNCNLNKYTSHFTNLH